MRTTSDALEKLLNRAATGQKITRDDLRSAGAVSDEWSAIERMGAVVAAIADGGEPTLAKRYAKNLLAEVRDADDVAKRALDGLDTDLDAPASSGSKRKPTKVADHPAVNVLDQVLSGRAAPDVDKLVALGFPKEIAETTVDAARTVAAAEKGGGLGVGSREIAHKLGRQIASDQPWPEPEDNWGDLKEAIPGAQVEHLDTAAIAAKALGQ